MVTGPALYVGRLRHRRFRPRPHAFTYSLFMVCLDVDAIDAQMAASPWLGVNRFAWASYDDRDHLGDPSLRLRERLVRDAARHGVALADGPIRLLTHLRYLGYGFNPISFYYCYDAAGRLAQVMGEVNNTFGGRCTYWFAADPARPGHARTRTPKTMQVSPFMDLDVDYEFAVTEPGETLVAHMNTWAHGDGAPTPYFDATLTLTRRPWTRREIHRTLARHPWMTAKVIGAIHWEALRLWLKRLPVHPHPRRDADRTRRGGVQG